MRCTQVKMSKRMVARTTPLSTIFDRRVFMTLVCLKTEDSHSTAIPIQWKSGLNSVSCFSWFSDEPTYQYIWVTNKITWRLKQSGVDLGCSNLCENLHNRQGNPLPETLFLRIAVAQTFTTDRGPPTVAMSIARSNFVCHSYDIHCISRCMIMNVCHFLPIMHFLQDPSLPVRRNAAHVVSTVASTCANSYSELVKETGTRRGRMGTSILEQYWDFDRFPKI